LVLIEHNLDVIKLADWIIDLGPDGGTGGGRVIATGRPEEVAGVAASHTGRWLRTVVPDASRVVTAGTSPGGKRVHVRAS
jgi:excinuclease ABC subunit A